MGNGRGARTPPLRKTIVEILTGEIFLRGKPNSAEIVFFRSLFVAGICSSVATFAAVLIHDRSTILSMPLAAAVSFIAHRVAGELSVNLKWCGGIFTGIFVVLQSRFGAQWAYLAGEYNQIKAAESRKDADAKIIASWKAGFLEDCEELHLARKPIFASQIMIWGTDDSVIEAYARFAFGGKPHLDELVQDVLEYCEKHGRWTIPEEARQRLRPDFSSKSHVHGRSNGVAPGGTSQSAPATKPPEPPEQGQP